MWKNEERRKVVKAILSDMSPTRCICSLSTGNLAEDNPVFAKSAPRRSSSPVCGVTRGHVANPSFPDLEEQASSSDETGGQVGGGEWEVGGGGS